MSKFIMKYLNGSFVERDDSTGPMSTGGYPMETKEVWRATQWDNREDALKYRHTCHEEWTLHEITVEVSGPLTISPREKAVASGDKEYAEFVRLSQKFGVSSDKCPFVEAWIGKCNKDTVPGELFCAKHLGEKCWKCKGQAVENCGHTSQFVCGMPYCKEHPHESEHRGGLW
jgi:hypothetical protein